MASVDLFPIVVVSVAVALFGYILWTFLKRFRAIYSWLRRGDAVEKKRDEAFNTLNTLRGMMRLMREKGKDVSDAGILLRKAARAYEEKDYDMVIVLGEDVKRALQEAPDKVMVGEEGGGERTTPAAALRLQRPRNFMEAKFMLQKAEGVLLDVERSGVDTKEARALLVEGRETFQEGMYDKALALALKVVRSVDPALVEPPGEEDGAAGSMEVPPPKTPQATVCAECSREPEPGDRFCRGCGRPLERSCMECGSPLKRSDRFCGRCGSSAD